MTTVSMSRLTIWRKDGSLKLTLQCFYKCTACRFSLTRCSMHPNYSRILKLQLTTVQMQVHSGSQVHRHLSWWSLHKSRLQDELQYFIWHHYHSTSYLEAMKMLRSPLIWIALKSARKPMHPPIWRRCTSVSGTAQCPDLQAENSPTGPSFTAVICKPILTVTWASLLRKSIKCCLLILFVQLRVVSDNCSMFTILHRTSVFPMIPQNAGLPCLKNQT